MGLARKAFSMATGGICPLPKREPAHRSLRQEVLRATQAAGEAGIGQVTSRQKSAAVAEVSRDIFKLFGGRP